MEMSNWNTVWQGIGSIIPDNLIVASFWDALNADYGSDDAPSNPIQVPDDVVPLTIPRNVLVQIVEKTCTLGMMRKPFAALRVVLAIGGVQPLEHSNLLKPGITFATLFFTEVGKLITYDLHEELR